MEHSHRVTLLAPLLFKVWKMAVFLDRTQMSFLTGFPRKWKKKSKLPVVTPENGLCKANMQFKRATNERKIVFRGTIKDESSRNFQLLLHKKCCQNWLFKFVWLDLSTNDLLFKTTSLCSENWAAYTEPTGSSFRLWLSLAAGRKWGLPTVYSPCAW